MKNKFHKSLAEIGFCEVHLIKAQLMNEGNVWVFTEEIATVTKKFISRLLCEICGVSGEVYNKL